MHHILQNIDNIIFDLGEVIVDVDTTKTVDAFKSLSNGPVEDLFSFSAQASFFSEFEKGNMNEFEFRNALRLSLHQEHSDDVLDDAWNAMLGNTPTEKLSILSALQKQFKTFALSNTNPIHIRYINEYLTKRKANDCLENYFHQTFYSYELGARKPEESIYQQTILDANIIAKRTLMIDDRKENLETASKMGMRVFHLEFPNQFYDLFPDYKNMAL